MKRIIPFIFMLIGCWQMALAQSAKEVLDKTAYKLQHSGGIAADFQMTAFDEHLKEQQNAYGTINMENDKFMVNSPAAKIWYDGKYEWTMLPNSGEVNKSKPTKEEIQKLQPYTFVNLYKNGYSYTMKPYDYKGKSCYEVDLRSRKKGNPMKRVVLVIDKDHTPLNIQVQDNQNRWVRFRIKAIEFHKHFDAGAFSFDKKKYPKIDIIDLT